MLAGLCLAALYRLFGLMAMLAGEARRRKFPSPQFPCAQAWWAGQTIRYTLRPRRSGGIGRRSGLKIRRP